MSATAGEAELPRRSRHRARAAVGVEKITELVHLVTGRRDERDPGRAEHVRDGRVVARELVRVRESHGVVVHDERPAEAEHALGDLAPAHVLRDGREARDVGQVAPPGARRELRRGELGRVGEGRALVLADVAEAGGGVRVERRRVVDEERLARHEGVEVEELAHLLDGRVSGRHGDEDRTVDAGLREAVQVGWRRPRVRVVPAVGSSEVPEEDDDRRTRAHQPVERRPRAARRRHDLDVAQRLGTHARVADEDRSAVRARFAAVAERVPVVAFSAHDLVRRAARRRDGAAARDGRERRRGAQRER
mmetsp:Transcript_15592/g.48324  ORF Transcript_15592/g.48324 Transcript_15592/m.48324 type:complete len:306 (-) Transcript_15592:452-1369(-)